MAGPDKNLCVLKGTQTNGVKTMATPYKKGIMFIEVKKIKIKILLWIQGWSGQLNSWAWTKWNKLHRDDWLKGYKKWKKDE